MKSPVARLSKRDLLPPPRTPFDAGVPFAAPMEVSDILARLALRIRIDFADIGRVYKGDGGGLNKIDCIHG